MSTNRLVHRCLELRDWGYSVERSALRVAEIYKIDGRELLDSLIDYIINNKGD